MDESTQTVDENLTIQTAEELVEEEKWLYYPGNNQYLVSSLGRVYSLITNIYLSPVLDDGYLLVGIKTNDKRKTKTKRIHILVLETFVGPRPDKYVARHFPNQVKTDNRLCNLSWGTCGQNSQDTLLADMFGSAKLTINEVLEIQKMIKEGVSNKEIALKSGMSELAIRNIYNNNTWCDVGEDLSNFESFRHKRSGSSLSINDVKLINLMIKHTNIIQKDIGKQFNVSHSAINNISIGKTFSDIQMPTMTLEEATLAYQNDEEII